MQNSNSIYVLSIMREKAYRDIPVQDNLVAQDGNLGILVLKQEKKHHQWTTIIWEASKTKYNLISFRVC